jgi:LEA14-like dessication related protein
MIIFIAVDTMTAIDGPNTNMNKEIIVVLKIDQPETFSIIERICQYGK